ncbi:uncharacterized protein RSE6_16128 [Rhynchosporium secalis]|uniref:DUF7918 domain-containing protein n=1 Tax=Rhynchosporium secalis TaxID=38038 RepID=A0A1E1MS87_RHYSE|nr:uncharacterized protein RSE6_16128 [Rhynchosporium secalis]
MAVLDSLQGIEVMVVVDGKALTEYSTENDLVKHTNPAAAAHRQARTVTKYIESTTDKAFLVRLSVKAPFMLDCPHLCFAVTADGQSIDRPLMSKEGYARGEWLCEVEGVIGKLESRGQLAAMKFSEIKTTDEVTDSAALKIHKLETDRVGEISISVGRETNGKTAAFKGCAFSELDSDKKYHEKVLAKDGKSHGVILGDRKSWILPRILHTTPIDGIDFPLGVFRFKYRSAAALRTLHVLPQPDDAGPADEEAAVAGEDDELRDLDPELRERMKRLLARAKGSIKSEPKIKRDHSDSEEDVKPSKKVKPAKRKKQIGKTTIDLTEDSDEEVPVLPLD